MPTVKRHKFKSQTERLRELALVNGGVGEPLENRSVDRCAADTYWFDPLVFVAAEQLTGVE